MWRKARLRYGVVVCGLGLVLCLGLARLGSAGQGSSASEKNVYVCGCAGTKSCPCMAMSNKAGKCPCGHDDMKAVARDSTWAETNRKALQ
jgi:hypothetical protein